MGIVKEPGHPLEKRDLLHKEPPDARRIDALATSLIDAGRLGEFIDYVEVTREPELIRRLEKLALENGSPFLLQQVERLTGGKHDEATWTALAERALQDERYVEAVRALTAGGLDERAEELRLEHCPDYEPFKPLGK